MALVFERCEAATQCAEIPNSDGFNLDIQAFVQHQEKDKRPFLTNDAEVDGLVSNFPPGENLILLVSTHHVCLRR